MPSAQSDASSLLRFAGRVVILAVYALSRARLLFRPSANPGTDLDFYFEYARRAARGDVPYVDFPVEYPPGAWLLIRAPATTDWVTYAHRFARIATTLELGAFALSLLIVRRIAPRHFWLITGTYVVATTLLREFLPTRLDSGLLFLLILWAWLALPGGAGASAGRRGLSYAVLGVATAFKLVPILILPFALVRDWRNAGRRPIQPVIWFAAGLALPFAVLWPATGSAALRFLSFHVERGLEVESIWATVLWPMRWLGAPVAAMHVGHTIEMTGPGAAALAQFSTLAAAAVLGLCLAAEHFRPWRGSAIVTATIGLAAFVTASKVMSPQYFVWMLPLLLVAGGEALATDRAKWWWSAGVVLVAALTWLIYPRFFLAVLDMRPLGFLLLSARNALLVALLIVLARGAWKR